MIKSLVFKLTILLLILTSANSVLATNTYFVATNGNDSNQGTAAQPWKTIQKAADTLVEGDTVQIMTGIYNQKFAPINSGMPGKYITYMPYPGAKVILDGVGINLVSAGLSEGLVQIIGKSYIKITGLNIRNPAVNGINIRPSDSGIKSSYIEISGNTIENTRTVGIKVNKSKWITIKDNRIKHVDYSSGIGVWNSEDILVDGNIIDTPHWYHECQGAYEEGLSISNVNRFEIKNNRLDYTEAKPTGYCSGAQRLGIDIKESSQYGKIHHNQINNFDAASIYVDGWHAGANGTTSLNHIDIYQNYTSNGGGITIGCEQSDGIVEFINIYNNFVTNSYFSGIQVRGAWGNGLRKNINIYNNTIYGASANGGNGGAGIYITTDNLKSNNSESPVIIRNNISNFYFLTNKGGTVGQIRTGNASMANKVTADHNIVFGPQLCSQDYANCVEVGSRVTADPTLIFVDPIKLDLHLKSGSPAINTGVNVGGIVKDDYDGAIRPQGSGFDIGADEYSQTSSVPTVPPTNIPTKLIVPGDANNDGKVDLVDFAIWKYEYINKTVLAADFNNSGKVDLVDFAIWKIGYIRK